MRPEALAGQIPTDSNHVMDMWPVHHFQAELTFCTNPSGLWRRLLCIVSPSSLPSSAAATAAVWCCWPSRGRRPTEVSLLSS